MSLDKTNSISDTDSQADTSGDTIAENNQAVKLDQENLKQDKLKQDQLKMERLRAETLRQEKLRQEFEDQEKERQKVLEQERLKQQKLKQEKLEQQKKIEQKKREREEQERLRVEKEYQQQLLLEAERLAQEKISKERDRQEQLMRERLERERLKKEELKQQTQQKIAAKKATNKQQADSGKTQKTPTMKPKFGFADKLRSTLKSVEDTVLTSKPSEDVASSEGKIEKKVETPQKTAFKQPVINARSIQLCGNLEAHDYAENSDKFRFDAEDYVLSSFLHYLDQTKRSMEVIRLKFEGVVVVIDYSLNTIYCSLSPTSPEFDKLCATPSSPNIDVYQLGYDEKLGERRNSVKLGNSIEAFVWTSTLLTAKGRLPEYTDTARTVGIKSNADFSRLEEIPYLDQMIARLKQNPCSLMELTSRYKIPEKYVYSFYNAAFNLNFLEFNVTKKAVKPVKQNTSKNSVKGFFRK